MSLARPIAMVVPIHSIKPSFKTSNSWSELFPNVECYRKSFKYAGGKICNGVPNTIQNAPSVEALKYAYKKLTFKQLKG